MPKDERGRLTPGTKLQNGAFTISRVLGQGGSGITYLAEQAGLRREVAVKEFYPSDFVTRGYENVVAREESVDFGELRARFSGEARILASLNHPSIVEVHGLFEENDTSYIVQEFVDGTVLNEHQCRSYADLMAWLLPIADAVGFVHESGYLHRDISPDNVMVREGLPPVLLDFGAGKNTSPDRTILQEKLGIWRECFSPIEQMTHDLERHGPWTDVYALAATAYFAASRTQPPSATYRQARIAAGEADPLATLKSTGFPWVTEALSDAIMAGLRLGQTERPQSVAAFMAAVPLAPIAAVPVVAEKPAAGPADKRWKWGAIAASIVAAAGIAWGAIREGDVAALTEERSGLEGGVSALQQEVRDLRNLTEQIEQQRVGLEFQLESLQGEAELLKTNLGFARAEANRLERLRDKALEKLDLAIAELKAAIDQNAEAEIRIAGLKRELELAPIRTEATVRSDGTGVIGIVRREVLGTGFRSSPRCAMASAMRRISDMKLRYAADGLPSFGGWRTYSDGRLMLKDLGAGACEIAFFSLDAGIHTMKELGPEGFAFVSIIRP